MAINDPYADFSNVDSSAGDPLSQVLTARQSRPPVGTPGADPTLSDTGGLVARKPGNQRAIANGVDTSGGWQWGTDEVTALLAGLNAGQSGQSWIDAYNSQFGLQPGSSLAYYGDSNTYALPSGYAAMGSNGQWGWNPRTASTSGGATLGTQPVGSPVSIPASPFAAGDATRSSQADALFNLLMGEAGQSLNVTPDDPLIKGQVDAYAAQSANQWRNTMSALAEKGGANTNTDAEARSVGEQLAQGTASYQAKLMSNELQSRRDQIQQAIAQGAGLLTAEQQMALEDEMNRLDAAINQSQFGQNLAERAYEFDATVNP